MSEKLNLNCENLKCLNCGTKEIFRNGLCSKCVAEAEYDDWESKLEQENDSSKPEMKVHSAGLRQSTNRGIEKIAKVKPANIKISFKK